MKFAVIFDLDGTLVDTAPDLTATTNQILQQHNLPPVSCQDLRCWVGLGAKTLIKKAFLSHKKELQPHELSGLYLDFLEIYKTSLAQESRPFEGAFWLLEQCKKHNISLGVCTNKQESFAQDLLSTLELAKFFDAIVGGDTTPAQKPNPTPYLETLKRLSNKGNTSLPSLFVGDSEIDLLTAKAAAVPFIGVTFGYSPTPMATFTPPYLADNLKACWPIIEQEFTKKQQEPHAG